MAQAQTLVVYGHTSTVVPYSFDQVVEEFSDAHEDAKTFIPFTVDGRRVFIRTSQVAAIIEVPSIGKGDV